MLKQGVVRPSKSAWGSVPIFVRKTTGEWRMAIDYRKVNSRMVRDSYPIPLLWDELLLASRHVWYTTLDLNMGFWNVPLEEESRQYTALLTHRGTFEYTVIPFGIMNSPGAFQRAMDMLFGHLKPRGVGVYIDDIVIYTNTWKEHLALLNDVLDAACKGGVYLKLKKGLYAQQHVKLLGHVVGVNGIKPNPEKVQAIHNAIAPSNRAELRSFLGLANYVSRFVPHFAHMTAPLNDLLKKGVKYEWGDWQEEAFLELKDAVIEYVTLQAPQGLGKFTLVTDASDRAIGAVLLQEQGDEL
eukprot:Lankesteria_metandrocarpae@DN5490_c1_g1_i2.p1